MNGKGLCVKIKDNECVQAHKHSSNHRNKILVSDKCGCFYCLETFSPSLIDEWFDDDSHGVGQTATCPKCGIDSVIGDASGYPVTIEFLECMKREWFY